MKNSDKIGIICIICALSLTVLIISNLVLKNTLFAILLTIFSDAIIIKTGLQKIKETD